jgi:predicted ester cyclase
MSPEENKNIIRRYIEEMWNKGNSGIIDELTTPNYIRYIAGPGGRLDREGQKKRISGFRAAFPDIHVTIEDLVAESDRVAVRVSITGTHQQQFQGIAPTGRRISITAIDIIHISKGKIVEHWGVTDQLTMLQQIGAIPTPG